MTTMQHAFHTAVGRLLDAGRLQQAPPWVLELARRLSELAP